MGLTDTEAGMAGDGGREDETGQEARSSRSPLVNRVHQRLLAWIEAGEFQTDQRLPGEMDLAAQFLVSRPVVREALRLLREQGLIYSRRGSGSFVRAASPSESSTRALGFAPVETIADIQRCYEFRLTIEPDHAYWAALRWNETMLAAIATALDLLRDATRAHQHREDADFAFHCAIAEASNNHYFVSSMTALKDHIGVGMKFHGVSLMGPTSALQGVFDEHAAIFDAIRNRDASRARNLMRSHLKGSRDRVFGGKILDLSF
ncbi:MAG: FadR/GntR family transcriptional regulator [Azospirillaceae bacterium]|nr:FadR/GntR family transcriptional regulator [Azospirillaceae bacterium]